MLENCKTAQERWGGTHEMIDRWLDDRKQTLIAFFEINDEKELDDVAGYLQTFCQNMVDYVSEGHFEIFEQLFREAREFDDGGIEVAKKLYPTIEASTQKMLDFNDKYQSLEQVQANWSDIWEDLSSLGVTLSERFDLEDQLIEKLHNAHKDKLV